MCTDNPIINNKWHQKQIVVFCWNSLQPFLTFVLFHKFLGGGGGGGVENEHINNKGSDTEIIIFKLQIFFKHHTILGIFWLTFSCCLKYSMVVNSRTIEMHKTVLTF